MEAHLYHVNITWSKDRRGIACSSELYENNAANACIEVATPPAFNKGVAGVWSPEHFFTAAVSSCLMTTFLAIAENSKLAFMSFTCHSAGKLEQVNGKFLMTEVLLEPVVRVKAEKDAALANKVLQKAEANCLISNSITAKVVMNPSVKVETVVSE